MIYLHTGLPGHGKTLNTIKEVDAASVEQDRPVYYHNINGLDPSKLKGQWYEFEDPHKWFELPDNSIIFVDECQHFFQPRDTRKERPIYIEKFQTHRHQGFDIHLVTQDMRFIDVEVRRLVGNHVHYWRPFGMNKISRYEYEKASDFDKVSERAFAKRTIVSVDKSLFGSYKSAVGHHVKVKLPFRVYVIIGVLLVCGFAFYRVYDRLNAKPEVAETPAAETSIQDKAKTLITGVTNGLGFTPDAASGGVSKLTPEQFLERQLPRVADLPSSAPIYDDLTRPVSYPRLYCMSSTDDRIVDRARARQQPVRYIENTLTTCQCYTQQGTRYKTEFEFCMQSSTEGYFDPAIPDRTGPNMQQNMPQQQASFAPQQQAPLQQVTVVPDGEYAARPWR